MEIPHWENTDKWGPLRDIVNQIIDSRNAALDLDSIVGLDLIKKDSDVYETKAPINTNWENVSQVLYAKRNGKTVDLTIYFRADWVSGNTTLSVGYELNDLYKGKPGSFIMGTMIISNQTFLPVSVLYSLNPNPYVTIASLGDIAINLEDGLMPADDGAALTVNISYEALNDISDFIS